MSESDLMNSSILIVDDLPSVRKVVARLLQKAGFAKTIEARDGNEALEKLRSEKIDVIISDWDMPHKNGLELLREMKQIDELKTLPFIMITSTADREDVVDALKSGVSDYVTKPFDVNALAEKIKHVIKQNKAA